MIMEREYFFFSVVLTMANGLLSGDLLLGGSTIRDNLVSTSVHQMTAESPVSLYLSCWSLGYSEFPLFW